VPQWSSTQEESSVAEFVKVAKANEIEPGQARLVDVKGKQIALFNVEGELFALENVCAHQGGPLADGEISGHEVSLARRNVRHPDGRGPWSASV
jgi:nitrite reductase/ring-hydroxylating ferredoxin subunit